MPVAQISQHARRMDAVWGSTEPAAWKSAHPGMIVSQYFIMGLDQYSVTGRGLSWWRKNHPDWIEYACASNGTPTHDVAYMRGINVPDVPVDIHNADADAYELQTWAQAAKSKGYTALAIDQVVFWNVEIGGNPNFGQHANRSEYACGTWHGSTFTRDYSILKDPRFEQDVVNYVALARSVAHKYGLTLIVNHPSGSLANADERELLADTDIDLDETGFSDYGHYRSRRGEIFKTELPYIRYAQEHGTGMLLIDRFDDEAHVDSAGLEYSLATYLLGDEGGLLLFVGGANGYGTMQYYSEYDTKLGSACSAVQQSGAIYSRRFSDGYAVVNAGANPQNFALPSGTYRDIEGRRISSSTLSLAPNDAYVLTGGPGC